MYTCHTVTACDFVLTRHQLLFFVIRITLSPFPDYLRESGGGSVIVGGVGNRQEPTEISKQPIRTRYLGYQPIRDQFFLIWSVLEIQPFSLPIAGMWKNVALKRPAKSSSHVRHAVAGHITDGDSHTYLFNLFGLHGHLEQEPTEISKQPIRTRYLGYQPIRDQFFLIWSVLEIQPFSLPIAGMWKNVALKRPAKSSSHVRHAVAGHITDGDSHTYLLLYLAELWGWPLRVHLGVPNNPICIQHRAADTISVLSGYCL
eukprot:sb/3468503/